MKKRNFRECFTSKLTINGHGSDARVNVGPINHRSTKQLSLIITSSDLRKQQNTGGEGVGEGDGVLILVQT